MVRPEQIATSALASLLDILRSNLLVSLLRHSHIGVSVDMGRSELASRHALEEKNVELFVGAALNLRETEVRPDEHGGGGRAPDEASAALEIPCDGVDGVGLQHLGHDVDELVGYTG